MVRKRLPISGSTLPKSAKARTRDDERADVAWQHERCHTTGRRTLIVPMRASAVAHSMEHRAQRADEWHLVRSIRRHCQWDRGW
jgi:hypothetical protein